MLIEFKVGNYRSFREIQALSLVASNSDKELPGNKIDRPLPGMSGLNYLKSVALYGPNASGKSNLLVALTKLASYIRISAHRLGPNDKTFAEPFKSAACLPEPSSFEVTFVADGVRYLFYLSLTKDRVIEESLVAYPKGLPQKWYIRKWNQETKQYDWEFPSEKFRKGRGLVEKTRPNAAFLSTAVQFEHPQLKPVYDWFEGTSSIRLGGEHGVAPSYTARFMNESPENHFLIEKLLRNADLGIESAQVKETVLPQDEVKRNLPPQLLEQMEQDSKEGIEAVFKTIQIELFHQLSGETNVQMDFDDEESEGTQRYFSLLGPWLNELRTGNVLVVDELETSLHPFLVRELIKQFNSDEHNSKGAQLIFTTHNPFLLDTTLFRRDQFWFTEKNREGATQLYPLTDFTPRKDESLTRGYLAGRYGGVPFIPEGLMR